MIVHVISQLPNGDLVCGSPDGRIVIDPFVGCAVETDDCIATGRTMIGCRYVMADYFKSASFDVYLCHRFQPVDGHCETGVASE